MFKVDKQSLIYDYKVVFQQFTANLCKIATVLQFACRSKYDHLSLVSLKIQYINQSEFERQVPVAEFVGSESLLTLIKNRR